METVKKIAPDKVNIIDQDRMMKIIIAEEKVKIGELQHQRENLIMTNTALDQELNRKKSQYEQFVRHEEEKLDQKRIQCNNEILTKEKKIEMGELDLSRRHEEMAHREKIGLAILEKQTKLNNDRIDVEKLRSRASLQMENADRKMSDAMGMFSQANLSLARAKEIEVKANAINDSIVKREQALIEKEKEVALSFTNLEEVKKIVDPKLQEIKDIEERIEINKRSVIEKENQVNVKIEQERELLRKLEIVQNKINGDKKELQQREDEVQRKILMMGIEDAK